MFWKVETTVGGFLSFFDGSKKVFYRLAKIILYLIAVKWNSLLLSVFRMMRYPVEYQLCFYNEILLYKRNVLLIIKKQDNK